MRFETVLDSVRGVPFIGEETARFLYRLIVSKGLTRVLELGIAHGTATCYIAAALDELGRGEVVAVDLLEAKDLFSPSPEEQLSRLGLAPRVRIVRTQTGYPWFLHDEIRRLTDSDTCHPEYDLCVIDGPKNWTIDGCSFFLVDKVLKQGGWLVFDDYYWTYADADLQRSATDGISHRLLSDEERRTPHVREIFELLVKQHPGYSDLALYPDWGWAVACKRPAVRKTYTIEYRYRAGGPSVVAVFLRGLRRRLWRS